MKRKFILFLLGLFFSVNSVSAFIVDEEFGFEKAMLMRNDIQNRLDLSASQQVIRSGINEKYHPLFNQKFAEIGGKITELRVLADSENCPKEQVDAIVNDFKTLEDELFEINQNYENEIKSMLTAKQKIKYSVLKFNNRRKLKKELNSQIKSIKKAS